MICTAMVAGLQKGAIDYKIGFLVTYYFEELWRI